MVACHACSSNEKATTTKTPTFGVKGSFLVDGKPVAGALVTFHPLHDPSPQATRSYAKTDQEGAFALSTYQIGDGAPAGKYIVTIVQDADDNIKVVPERFGSPKTSDLRAEVQEGINERHVFRLPRR